MTLDCNPFLDQFFQNLKADKIDVANFELDHVCYRVETEKRYKEMKIMLDGLGQKLTEFKIRKREISTYHLNKPIVYLDREIHCIELSSPREDLFFPEGFEHAEFVINESLTDFMGRYPNIEFNTEALNRELNPELIRQYEGIAVKFHNYSLEYTIKNLQKN